MEGDEDEDDDAAFEAVTTVLTRDAFEAAMQQGKLERPAASKRSGGFIVDEPTLDVSDDAIEVFDERRAVSRDFRSTTKKPFESADAVPTRRRLPSITEKISGPESLPDPPTIPVPRHGSVPPPPLPTAKPAGTENVAPRRGSVPPPPPPFVASVGAAVGQVPPAPVTLMSLSAAPSGPKPATPVRTVPRPASVAPPPLSPNPSRQITGVPGVMPAVPRPASVPPPPPAAPPRPTLRFGRTQPLPPQASVPAKPAIFDKPPMSERKATLPGFPSPAKGFHGTQAMSPFVESNPLPHVQVTAPAARPITEERTVVMSHSELFSAGRPDASPFAAGHSSREQAPTMSLRRRVEMRLSQGETLAGLDLEDADLSGLDLSRQTLAKANLRGANLRGARLEGTDLTEVHASEAVFSGIRGASAKFDRADLTGATFDGADLSGASFVRAELTGARGDGAVFVGAIFEHAHFSGGAFRRAVFDRAELGRADFTGAVLDRASFIGAHLVEAWLYDVSGEGMTFDDAVMTGVHADAMRVQRPSFLRIDAANSVWDGATLGDAQFREANLAKASFQRTIAERANFSRRISRVRVFGTRVSSARRSRMRT